MISFTVTADSTPFLPSDRTDADAMITVRARDDGHPDPQAPEYAEVIVIDCSGSMAKPPLKIAAARQAACAAVDSLRPGTWFAVIRGTQTAEKIYPFDAGMARATRATRADAKRAIEAMEATGGTAIGSWLLTARDLLGRHPAAIRHTILLTDGRNEHESAVRFQAALADCRGHFQCDSRGVGQGWLAGELTAISDTLLGTAQAVARETDLVEDFTRMATMAMARALPSISLRVWVPKHARISVFKQVTPTFHDLLGQRVAAGALESEFPTGAWGAETRTYHLAVSGLVPRMSARSYRLARVEVVPGAPGPAHAPGPARTPGPVGAAGVADRRDALASAPVTAAWTSDPALYTRRSLPVEFSRGVVQFASLFTHGLDALRQGERSRAAGYLARARDLAYGLNDREKIQMLEHLLQAEPATGRIGIRPDVTPHELEVFTLRSRVTRPSPPRDEP